ncbi:MAG: putative metal-binding motif-containing protein, partial [Myxococcota bacterium]|nr:putative metal-binding motif-containing protein [Myxococcota bacterium]
MRWFAPAIVVLIVLLVACGSNDAPNLLIVHFDAGADAPDDVAADGPADAAVDDANPYLGGPCVDDGQCNDMIRCTYDSCDQTAHRCANIPDDSLCDNGVYCDGRERCVPRRGCVPGPVVSCSDGNACHIADCVEASKSCAYVPRDVDQDGDPDGHCMDGHDCNDLDPNVSSLRAEVCGNGIDDNCNGRIDEMPCVTPLGNTCATAVAVAGPGTYRLSTIGCTGTFTTSCSVTTPSAAQNVTAAVTVPPGPNVDLEVWVSTSNVEVALALQKTCGLPSSEIACSSAKGATTVRARGRNLAPGTYYVVVTTQSPTPVDLKVAFLSPTPAATNVDCATARPLQPGVPTIVSIIDPPTSLASACTVATTGQLTYSFAVTQPYDVRVYASTMQGSGSPVVGLRDPTCKGASDELTCRSGAAVAIYRRNLSPGTYVLTVAATSPIDATIDVELSPPSVTPADQTCSSSPAIVPNTTVAFDLSNHEDGAKAGCYPGGPDAAYDLTLAGASDVLLVARTPKTEQGAVALDDPSCTMTVACTTGTTPIRINSRDVAAGNYRVIVTDQLGSQGTLQALVRPAVAPTIIPAGGADTCSTAVDASAGGFFTGDTSTATADYSNPCDTPTSAPGGAPDQVLALNLAQPQRVVFDMEGSAYTTILDVRQGPSCPGAPVTGACYVGSEAPRSFLDLELQAGQY